LPIWETGISLSQDLLDCVDSFRKEGLEGASLSSMLEIVVPKAKEEAAKCNTQFKRLQLPKVERFDNKATQFGDKQYSKIKRITKPYL
jgi:hypothetical protein